VVKATPYCGTYRNTAWLTSECGDLHHRPFGI